MGFCQRNKLSMSTRTRLTTVGCNDYIAIAVRNHCAYERSDSFVFDYRASCLFDSKQHKVVRFLLANQSCPSEIETRQCVQYVALSHEE